jgi:hypothetical protein
MKFFKRKPKPRAYWVSLQPTVTMPECPLHGARCGSTFMESLGVWLTNYAPCEVREAAIERAEWRERYQHYWNPATEEWTILER